MKTAAGTPKPSSSFAAAVCQADDRNHLLNIHQAIRKHTRHTHTGRRFNRHPQDLAAPAQATAALTAPWFNARIPREMRALNHTELVSDVRESHRALLGNEPEVQSTLPRGHTTVGRSLLWTGPERPTVEKAWADQGFAGRLVAWAADTLRRRVEIVRMPEGQRGFAGTAEALGDRADVCLDHHAPPSGLRRRTRPAHAETMICWAMTDVIMRRLTRGRPAVRQRP